MNAPDQTSFSGKPITDIAASLGLTAEDIIPYGDNKAKVRLDILERNPQRGKLILVSAITPTPAGEGKTTTTIGLGQALRHLNLAMQEFGRAREQLQKAIQLVERSRSTKVIPIRSDGTGPRST